MKHIHYIIQLILSVAITVTVMPELLASGQANIYAIKDLESLRVTPETGVRSITVTAISIPNQWNRRLSAKRRNLFTLHSPVFQ